MGFEALASDTLGSRSTAIGTFALKNQNFTTAVDSYNTAVGYNAGTTVSTGQINTMIGYAAGDSINTGDNNTIVGGFAGDSISTGDLNVCIGASAGGSFSTVSNNTFVGAFAGDVATSGDNTGIGSGALGGSLTGDQNVAVGKDAANGLTGGSDNVFVGHLAGVSAGAASSNTCVGEQSAGGAVFTGANNTMLGRGSGFGVTSGSNLLLLGVDAGRSSAPGGNHTNGSNSIVVGNNSSTNAYIKIDWTVTSDERDKTDFTALDLGLDFVKSMKPYTFKWDQRSDYGDSTAADYKITDQTPDGTHKKDQLDVGFKAQDIEALEKAAGYKISDKTNLIASLTPDETQYGLKYSKFVPILVKAIQEQNALIEALTARVTTLEG